MIKKKVTAVITGLLMIMGFTAVYGQEAYCDEISLDDNFYANSIISEETGNSLIESKAYPYDTNIAASSIYATATTTGEIKSGNSICTDIKLNKIETLGRDFFGCSMRLKYDPDVYEFEGVTPGEMCGYSQQDFYVKDNNEKGEIYIQELHGKYDCGESFASVNFKVKDNYNTNGDTSVYMVYNQAALCIFSNSMPVHLPVKSYDYTTLPKNVPDIKVDVEENSETISNSVNPTFTITNLDTEDIDLSKVKLHYYYTEDGISDEVFNCYYAGTTDGTYRALTSNVIGKIVRLNYEKKTETVDSYIDISFNGGTLNAGQSMVVQANVNKNDWSDYDKTNDYSYNNAEKVSAFFNDIQAWGVYDDKVDNINPSYQGIGTKNILVNVEPVDKNLKDGDKVIVPVRCEGISSRHNEIYTWKIDVKYDTDVFENPEVKAGYVCKNIDNNFSSNVNEGTGVVTMNYFDYDRDCIESDGVLAFVTLTVKDAAAAAGKDSLVYGVNKGNFVDRYDSVLGVVYSNTKSTEAQLTGEYDPGKEQ